MKITPALPGTTLLGVVIYALSGTPWMLLALIIVVLSAVLGFVHAYVGFPKNRRDAVLELIRTLQGR
jgi:hypothetical protein